MKVSLRLSDVKLPNKVLLGNRFEPTCPWPPMSQYLERLRVTFRTVQAWFSDTLLGGYHVKQSSIGGNVGDDRWHMKC